MIAQRRDRSAVSRRHHPCASAANRLRNRSLWDALIGHPLEGKGVGLVDACLMLGISVVLLVIARTGCTLRRWEGALLLAVYGAYMWHLWPKG